MIKLISYWERKDGVPGFLFGNVPAHDSDGNKKRSRNRKKGMCGCMMCMMVTEHAEGVIDCTAWKKSPVKINMICTHCIKQCIDKSFLGNYTLTDILWQDPGAVCCFWCVFANVCLKFKCVLKPISDIMGTFLDINNWVYTVGTTQEDHLKDLTCVWAAGSHEELGERWLCHALQNTCK